MVWTSATVVLLGTAAVIVGLLFTRVRECRFWRLPENNRRKEARPFEGEDRRRCSICGYERGNCRVTGDCRRTAYGSSEQVIRLHK